MYCITMAGILIFVQKIDLKNQQNPEQNFGSSHHMRPQSVISYMVPGFGG